MSLHQNLPPSWLQMRRWDIIGVSRQCFAHFERSNYSSGRMMPLRHRCVFQQNALNRPIIFPDRQKSRTARERQRTVLVGRRWRAFYNRCKDNSPGGWLELLPGCFCELELPCGIGQGSVIEAQVLSACHWRTLCPPRFSFFAC